MQLKIVFEKTIKQKKIQENGKYHKCSFSQSHTSQNQHKKAKKIKRRRSRIPNPKLRGVFEGPKDLLNCYPM
jgi:hypothetical protein